MSQIIQPEDQHKSLPLNIPLCARRRLLIDSHLISHQTFRADIALTSRQPPFVLISFSLELCPGT